MLSACITFFFKNSNIQYHLQFLTGKLLKTSRFNRKHDRFSQLSARIEAIIILP
jgi:hypothetical protein